MISLLHFVSIFTSILLLALGLTIIQVMLGTYRDRIIAALKLGDMDIKAPVVRVARREGSRLTLPA